MLGRLREPGVRQRIAREVEERGLTSFGRVPSWDAVSGSTSRTGRGTPGRSLAELARTAGVAPIDLVCDLLAADEGATFAAVSSIDESDGRELCYGLRPCSWARTVEPSRGTARPGRASRPRASTERSGGSSAAVRTTWGLLSLPDAVFKMTDGPPRTLGLVKRGRATGPISPRTRSRISIPRASRPRS